MIIAHLKYYRGITALVLFCFFTACTKVGGFTIDVQGPDIEFKMAFFDADNQREALKMASSGDHKSNQDAFWDYRPIAKSDTIYALDIEAFLSEVGQTFNSVVEKAELKNSKITSEGFIVEEGEDIKKLDKVIGRDRTIEVLKDVYTLGMTFLSRNGFTISIGISFNVFL